MYKQMLDKLKEINISPVYFIGSGISRRYVDTPDWIGLLEVVRNDWDRSFERYKQNNTVNGVCNCEELATELEKMYFEKLEDKELIEGKEKGYYFRKRVCDILVEKTNENIETIENNDEVQELKKTSPSAIITTNYDSFMEKLFPTYTVYVGQTQLLQKNIDGVGDIYKIHGCVSDASSIVITRKDYEHFYKSSHYLNAKLLTSFLEYPTIFMGYSLSDRNVRSILDTIVDMLGEEKSCELSNRMWFLRRNAKDIDYKSVERIKLNEGRFLDVTVFYVKNFSDFFKIINNHDIKRVPVQFLKYIKANTYKVISSQEFDPKVINANLVDLENYDETKNVMNFLSITKAERGTENVVMNRNDICNSFIERNDNIKEFSTIKFKFNNSSIIPVYWNIKNKKASEVINYINEGCCTKNCKEGLVKNINDKAQVKSYKFISLNAQVAYTEKLEIDLILKHLSYLYRAFRIKGNNDEKRLKKQLSLYFINYRLSELVQFGAYIEMYREELIDILECLEKEFIRKNENNIFVLLSMIDDHKYSGKFRKALLYIDKCLYKDAIVH